MVAVGFGTCLIPALASKATSFSNLPEIEA